MYLRIWEELDVHLVAKHLLIVGDLTGDYAHCRALGIDYATQKACPACKTDFKYMALRRRQASDPGLIKRFKEKRPDLIFIDYTDFKNALDRLKAKEFFSK